MRVVPAMTCVSLLLLAPVAAAGSAPSAPPSTLDRAKDIFSVGEEFLPAEVRVSLGQKLTLTNLEPAPHNVISTLRTKKGVPLFGSATVTTAGTADVVGVPKLMPGFYPFICSVHPAMRGVLEVSAP